MTLTDYIELYLRKHPNGATTAEIQRYCSAVGAPNFAQSETKNISGICSHKCSKGEWFKRNMGGYYIWSVYPR